MKTVNEVREEITAIASKYGQLHEENCGENNEDGSDDGCDCAMSELVNEIAEWHIKERRSLLENTEMDIVKNRVALCEGRLVNCATVKIEDVKGVFKELKCSHKKFDKDGFCIECGLNSRFIDKTGYFSEEVCNGK